MPKCTNEQQERWWLECNSGHFPKWKALTPSMRRPVSSTLQTTAITAKFLAETTATRHSNNHGWLWLWLETSQQYLVACRSLGPCCSGCLSLVDIPAVPKLQETRIATVCNLIYARCLLISDQDGRSHHAHGPAVRHCFTDIATFCGGRLRH